MTARTVRRTGRPRSAACAARTTPALVPMVLALALAAAGCAKRGPEAPPTPSLPPIAPEADSVTAALWRFDESGGTRAADAGPFGLHAAIGLETRTDFGRYRSARVFTRTIESFVLAPYNPVMESPRGLTVEAWVNPNDYGQYELTPIAARWTPVANEQSWLLGVTGHRYKPPFARLPSPGYFDGVVRGAALGRLVFVVQPELAAGASGWLSTSTIELKKWTHVAATYDGDVVKLYVDGRLDAQYVMRGGIRHTEAPLLVGNEFDPRRLSDFSGQLRYDPNADNNPYYAFEGAIDELRLSGVPRASFESTRLR